MSLMTIALISSGAIFAQKDSAKNIESEIKMFPDAKPGYKQVYIKVPTKKNENNLKVEIFVGKTQMVDCNRHFMGGTIQTVNLEGWGYDYYVVESEGVIGSTKMACPDNKMTKEFVHMESKLLRYNSKLPIVIYVPEGLEVNYKIWKAGKKMKSATTSKSNATSSVNSSIENKRWKLIELNGKPVEGNAETHYLILHTDNHRIEAKAGCNIIIAEYDLKNEFQLSFEKGATTMMACPDNLEDEFLEVLNTIDNFTTDGTYLSLNKARMAPLARFELVQ